MKKLYILIFLPFILGCGSFQKEIVISRDTIQSAMAAKFPYDKNMVIAKVSLREPNIYFTGSNIGININYWANFLEKEIEGKVNINGHIRYEKGAFYMDSLELADITMNEKEFSSDGKLQKIVINLIKNYLDSFPVYRLKQSDFKQEIARLLLKDIVVEGDSLKIIVGL
jgi:hypothetical protein